MKKVLIKHLRALGLIAAIAAVIVFMGFVAVASYEWPEIVGPILGVIVFGAIYFAAYVTMND